MGNSMETDSPRKGHSVWLPRDLDSLVHDRASSLGLSYNNVVIDALHQMFGLDRDPMSALMQGVRMWLLNKYSRKEFSEDVILESFQYIQGRPELMSRYNQILEDSGRARSSAQATLNRRIGQAVTQILQGEVTARKVPAKGCSLIKGYSKLKPRA